MRLTKVVVFFDRLFDLPDTFQTDRKDNEVTGAESNRMAAVGPVGNSNPTLENQAGFVLAIVPVELTDVTVPGGPGFTKFRFIVVWPADKNIFNSGHKKLLQSLKLTDSPFDNIKNQTAKSKNVGAGE